MSVLTQSELYDELNSGSLVVSPLIDPKVQIGQVSIDLRMGNTAAVVRGAGLSHVDPAEYAQAREQGHFSRERDRRRKLERISVPFGEPVVLHAGALILVPTFEWVRLPNNLMGIVTARSCWAREGLSIATAVFIDPCYNGIITLELANLGQIPIKIYPGMRIAQIALYRTKEEKAACSLEGRGQFHGSIEPANGDIIKEDEDFLPSRSSN